MSKDGFKYLSKEFDSKVLGLVKEKGFYPYEYLSGFQKFKEEGPRKKKFYSSLTGKKITDKEYEHILKVWDRFEMRARNDYHNLHLECDVLLLADVLEKLRNSS